MRNLLTTTLFACMLLAIACKKEQQTNIPSIDNGTPPDKGIVSETTWELNGKKYGSHIAMWILDGQLITNNLVPGLKSGVNVTIRFNEVPTAAGSYNVITSYNRLDSPLAKNELEIYVNDFDNDMNYCSRGDGNPKAQVTMREGRVAVEVPEIKLTNLKDSSLATFKGTIVESKN